MSLSDLLCSLLFFSQPPNTHTYNVSLYMNIILIRQLFVSPILGDNSAGRNAEIDWSVQGAIDPDILVDLRHRNMNGSDKYGVFWVEGRKFLDECTAIQGISVYTYMAKVISVCDLVEQVSVISWRYSYTMGLLAISPTHQSSCTNYFSKDYNLATSVIHTFSFLAVTPSGIFHR